MSKLRRYYYGAVDAVSGGRVYHARWMFKLGIPPVPLWTVEWFFNLRDQLSGRGGARGAPKTGRGCTSRRPPSNKRPTSKTTRQTVTMPRSPRGGTT
jgi:hypothetical protein